MSAASELREMGLVDTGYLNGSVFPSKKHGLVATRDVVILLLDLDDHEDVRGFIGSTQSGEATLEVGTDYAEISVKNRRLQFCVRLPLPEYEDQVRDITVQGTVALTDFDNPIKAILFTFED